MSGQQRVQVYLERHKIGVLFEELMGKVISDMPDEPIVYLIRALQRKATRLGLSTETGQLRKSTDNGQKTRSMSPVRHGTYPGMKKVTYADGRDYEQYLVQSSPPHGYRSTWQAEGMAVPKERAYEKPWQSNTKRPSSGHPARKSGGKPDWNADTKVKTSDLDDLWGSKGEGQMKVRGRSPSPAKRGTTKSATVWTDGAVEDDQEFLYSSYGYSGPRRQETLDPLEGELINSRDTSSDETSSQPRMPVSKRSDQRSNSERHKQELQRLILDRKKAEDSGIEDDRDLEQDDAVELMENLDDLRNEGVTNVKSSTGTAVRSTARVRTVPAEPQVRVSICARCAKVMTGERSAAVTSSNKYGQVADYVQEDNFPESRPQSAVRFSPGPGESDEEFESVSQVTGPRRPVWQDDSDAETVTPRKGKHMFASSTVPAKGRPMFSPEAGRTAQSQDFQHSTGRTYVKNEPSPFHKTWSPEVRSQFSSSDEEDIGRHGGWQVHEHDDGSSFYGSPGQKGKKQYSGAY